MTLEPRIKSNRGTSEEEESEVVGEFISQKDWDEVGPIMAAIRQMEPEIKKWVKEAAIEAIIQFISDYEITVGEEDSQDE